MTSTQPAIDVVGWKRYLVRLNPRQSESYGVRDRDLPRHWLTLDPGETTGFAFWLHTTPIYAGEFRTSPVSLNSLIDAALELIVCEDYRIYPHMAYQHINSRVPTIRVIGAIEMLAWQRSISVVFQSAAQAKQFCNDQRMREWDLYQRGQPHATDALRHGAHYVLFGKLSVSAVATSI